MGETANPVLDHDDHVVKVGLRLEARLVAFEVAMTRAQQMIPRSLVEFLEPSTGGRASRS